MKLISQAQIQQVSGGRRRFSVGQAPVNPLTATATTYEQLPVIPAPLQNAQTAPLAVVRGV